ncbi:MAG: GDP-mannose 4,6-dehydratase [Desulfobacterales bacterium]|nr:MAG: GDP-mannose 4,6-dehydratase [Desulfobacterales bacterium]
MTVKWLISGGCGFIGLSLIQRLIEKGGNAIRVLDNLSVGTKTDLSGVCSFSECNISVESLPIPNRDRVQLVVCDIKDSIASLKCAEDMDIIVHLAANTGVESSVQNPRADMETNVLGLFNMLEAARLNRTSKFIFASSGAPVGEVEPPIHEEVVPHPVSPYGASKLAGEGYCSAYFRTFGLNTIVLRFGNVYGPGSLRKGSIVAKFVKQVLRGEACEIYGDGNQTRDFIYISDLVEAIIKSSACDCRGEIFQIASSREHTVNEVAMALRKILAEHGHSMTINYGDRRVGDVLRNYSDTSKACAILGWQADYNLQKGLAETVVWFLDQKRKGKFK